MTKQNELLETWNRIKNKFNNNKNELQALKKELAKEKGWWDKWLVENDVRNKEIINPKHSEGPMILDNPDWITPGKFEVRIKVLENNIRYSLQTDYPTHRKPPSLWPIERNHQTRKEIFKYVISKLFE